MSTCRSSPRADSESSVQLPLEPGDALCAFLRLVSSLVPFPLSSLQRLLQFRLLRLLLCSHLLLGRDLLPGLLRGLLCVLEG